MRFCALFTLALGCAAAEDENNPCTVGELDGGAASASVGGTRWVTEGSWSWTADGVQIVLDEAVGFQMTLKLNTVEGGDTIRDAVDGDAWPAKVSFSGDSGTASVRENRTNGLASYGTNQPGGGGHLWLSAADEQTLEACFEFDAASDDGSVVDVTDGELRVGS
jgi:hypothetical protein